MIYRRRKKSDTWHFVRTCRWWPKKDFKASAFVTHELCNECRVNAKR